MDDTGVTWDELVARIATASEELRAADDALEEAQKGRLLALMRLGDLQRALDARVRALRDDAPSGSAWSVQRP